MITNYRGKLCEFFLFLGWFVQGLEGQGLGHMQKSLSETFLCVHKKPGCLMCCARLTFTQTSGGIDPSSGTGKNTPIPIPSLVSVISHAVETEGGRGGL